ncbi:MAG: fibronectin type III domain-containing protein, partial [Candidatus Latescibacteria bacterium]|nr:fibronectin type III domain-containing protein [Candidatus Latescibacterota bacterium]
TDEPSDSWVEYGFDDGYGQEAGREEWVRKHGVRLTGLEPDTTITLRVRSVDRSGNVGFSGAVTFRTRPTPDTKPPRMILAPVAMARTDEAVTVAWTTDEVSNSWVTYGVVDTTTHEVSDTSYAGSEEAVTDHRVRLTGFEAGAVVRYRVSSTDPSGNRMMSGMLTFRTKAAPDVSPPRILTGPVAVFRDQYSAVIEWTTHELSDSRVEYGETSEYGFLAEGDDRVRLHRVAILDLESDTEYHIRVRSTDLSGNETISEGRTFRTKAVADLRPPVILTGPSVVGRMHDSATILWTTDEPSDSWVTVGIAGDGGEIVGAKILVGEATFSDVHGELRGEGRDVRVHTVVLTNLSPGTRYTYQVASTDPSGNGPTDKLGSFVTMLEPDADPPVILSGPMVYWTDRIATVKWVTDERSTSVVYYGTVETYGTDLEEEIAGDDFGVTYVRKHRVT